MVFWHFWGILWKCLKYFSIFFPRNICVTLEVSKKNQDCEKAFKKIIWIKDLQVFYIPLWKSSPVFRYFWNILWKYLKYFTLKLFFKIHMWHSKSRKGDRVEDFSRAAFVSPGRVERKERTTAVQSYTNAFCAGIGPAPTSRLLCAAIRVYEIIV